MSQDARHTRIARYLNNELSVEEVQQFEAEIANDPALAREVQVQKTVDWGLHNQVRLQEDRALLKADQLLKDIADAYDNAQIAPNGTIRPLRLMLLIAAAAVIGLLILFFWPGPDPAIDYLAEYSEQLRFKGDLRSGQEPKPGYTEALALYKQNKGTEAARILLDSISSIPNPDDEPTYRLDVAKCYYKAGQLTEAYETLVLLFAQPGIQEKAKWHAALIILNLGSAAEKKELAYPLLLELADRDPTLDNTQGAKNLLKQHFP